MLESQANANFFILRCLQLLEAKEGEDWMQIQGLRGILCQLLLAVNHFLGLDDDVEYWPGVLLSPDHSIAVSDDEYFEDGDFWSVD